jgi:hypothetical protein
MHYRDIASEIKAKKLRRSLGQSPATTVNMYINNEINERGDESAFVRVRMGVYALRETWKEPRAPSLENHDLARREGISAMTEGADWRMDVESGNAGDLDTEGSGWFVGFSEYLRGNGLRYMAKNSLAHTVCLKWMVHPKDDDRGQTKPPSDGRTISILVSENGRFRLEFSASEEFPSDDTEQYVLERRGDFVVWGENLYHRWFVDETCTVLTLRWTPIQAWDA